MMIYSRRGEVIMKIIIIGCTHAGTAAVNRIYMQHPDAQVTIYKKTITFLSYPAYPAESLCT